MGNDVRKLEVGKIYVMCPCTITNTGLIIEIIEIDHATCKYKILVGIEFGSVLPNGFSKNSRFAKRLIGPINCVETAKILYLGDL